jgi:heme/copper-type cytochrome/quinol oxidase subunit 3
MSETHKSPLLSPRSADQAQDQLEWSQAYAKDFMKKVRKGGIYLFVVGVINMILFFYNMGDKAFGTGKYAMELEDLTNWIIPVSTCLWIIQGALQLYVAIRVSYAVDDKEDLKKTGLWVQVTSYLIIAFTIMNIVFYIIYGQAVQAATSEYASNFKTDEVDNPFSIYYYIDMEEGKSAAKTTVTVMMWLFLAAFTLICTCCFYVTHKMGGHVKKVETWVVKCGESGPPQGTYE